MKTQELCEHLGRALALAGASQPTAYGTIENFASRIMQSRGDTHRWAQSAGRQAYRLKRDERAIEAAAKRGHPFYRQAAASDAQRAAITIRTADNFGMTVVQLITAATFKELSQ